MRGPSLRAGRSFSWLGRESPPNPGNQLDNWSWSTPKNPPGSVDPYRAGMKYVKLGCVFTEIEIKVGILMSEDSLDEINQIMNDIEKLQSKPTAEAEPASAPESTISMSDFGGGGSGEGGGSMEDTLGGLQEEASTGGLLSSQEPKVEEAEAVIPAAEDVQEEAVAEAAVVPITKTVERPKMSKISNGAGAPGTLSMTLKGDMELELNYEAGEQSVALRFEDGFFIVQLADGTEFRVPMKNASASRKSA